MNWFVFNITYIWPVQGGHKLLHCFFFPLEETSARVEAGSLLSVDKALDASESEGTINWLAMKMSFGADQACGL